MTEVVTDRMNLETKAQIINRAITSAFDYTDDGLKSRIRILNSCSGPIAQAQLLALETEVLGRELWMDWEPRVVDDYRLTDEDRVFAKLDDGSDPDFDWYPLYPENHPNHPDYDKTRDVSEFDEARERDWVNLAG